ncbi:hypothetical protein LJC14_06440 [Treponema sp. OttesenSCG-928-L16]|nr:hypothetical protein [Treponema sp. OttesenSCG-928-L16]
MAVLSLDIGTTKICALAVDEDGGAILETLFSANAFLPSPHSYERIQDPDAIFRTAENMCAELIGKYAPIRCIGISGQMHGIVYTDSSGTALSPLYTWQDMRASLSYRDGMSYAGYLHKLNTGNIAAGYGLATHFYQLKLGLVPAGASSLCTIGDYIAMRLCSLKKPLMHSTNADSIGFFNISGSHFEYDALEAAGINPHILPAVTGANEILGKTKEGIPVCVAIGDNQASFLGSVRDSDKSVLVNVGTGSQLSLVQESISAPHGLETRPFFDRKLLLVGAALCGGRAYAILERFFQELFAMSSQPVPNDLYSLMDRSVLEVPRPDDPLTVKPLFAGTRKDPFIRGSIENISQHNFTPSNLIRGFLEGIADELHEMYRPVRDSIKNKYQYLILSGNGARKNIPLIGMLSEKFNLSVEMPRCREEAAYGAALFALTCTGHFTNVSEAQKLIQYQSVCSNTEASSN